MKQLLLTVQSQLENALKIPVAITELSVVAPAAFYPPFILLKDGDIQPVVYEQEHRDGLLNVEITVYSPVADVGSGVMGSSNSDGVLTLMEKIKDQLIGKTIGEYAFVSVVLEPASEPVLLNFVDSDSEGIPAQAKGIILQWDGCQE